MTEYKNDLEYGTVGSSVATGSGGTSGSYAIGAVGTVVITNAAGEVLSGTKSARCAGAAGTANYITGSTALSTTATHAYAALRFMDSAYDSGEQFFLIRNTTTSPANKFLNLNFDASGKVYVGTSGGTVYTTPAALPLPGAYIVETLSDSGTSTTDGKVKFRIRNFATGALAAGMTDWVEFTGKNLGAGLMTATFQVGKLTTLGAAAKTIIVDDLYIGDGYAPGGPTPPPTVATQPGTVLASDTFTGADGTAPNAAMWTPTLAASGGSVALLGNQVALTPGAVAWAGSAVSLFMSGAPAVFNTDWDLMATLAPKNPISGQYIAFGVSNNGSVRSGDVLPGYGYAIQLAPGSGLIGVSRVTSGSVANLSGDLPYTFTPGVAVNLRIAMVGGSTLKVWVWDVGTPVPSSPTWTATDAAPLTGSFRPILTVSNASSATPTAASFDNVSFASIAATQGVFIHDGTQLVHYVAMLWDGTKLVAMPAQETA